MDKKTKNVVILLCAYLLIFWIGFKSGAAYLRMQNKVQVEMIEIPTPPPPLPMYYVIEKRDYGSYSNVEFTQALEDNPIIKIFMNEKMRPLLKARNIEIYKADGERIY